MTNADDDAWVCPHCRAEAQPDNDFCPECGEILSDGIFCSRHEKQAADGVCVICLKPFCAECGGRVLDRFLCGEHEAVEIYEGMARVYGSSDTVQVDFGKDSLEAAGLHPLVFTRKASPISLGGPDYTLFRASGEHDGHIVNEIKLMVPCQEFVQAQQVLTELEFFK